MKLNQKMKVLGVRSIVGKKDPTKTYYNVDLRVDSYNYSFSASEAAARMLENVPFGEEHILEFDYFPDRSSFGLGRLTVVGVVK